MISRPLFFTSLGSEVFFSIVPLPELSIFRGIASSISPMCQSMFFESSLNLANPRKPRLYAVVWPGLLSFADSLSRSGKHQPPSVFLKTRHLTAGRVRD